MKTFLGSDYSLVFFKLPNQLEGIVKKKNYYSNSLGDVEPGGIWPIFPPSGRARKIGVEMCRRGLQTQTRCSFSYPEKRP